MKFRFHTPSYLSLLPVHDPCLRNPCNLEYRIYVLRFLGYHTYAEKDAEVVVDAEQRQMKKKKMMMLKRCCEGIWP